MNKFLHMHNCQPYGKAVNIFLSSHTLCTQRQIKPSINNIKRPRGGIEKFGAGGCYLTTNYSTVNRPLYCRLIGRKRVYIVSSSRTYLSRAVALDLLI